MPLLPLDRVSGSGVFGFQAVLRVQGLGSRGWEFRYMVTWLKVSRLEFFATRIFAGVGGSFPGFLQKVALFSRPRCWRREGFREGVRR